MTCTAFAGVLALNYQSDYTEWVLPLIIVCLFAFLVAHCFLSIFEIVVDVLFLCFAIDTKYNDGTAGKEFYMDKALMVSTLWKSLIISCYIQKPDPNTALLSSIFSVFLYKLS